MGTTTDVTPPCPKSPPKYPDLCGRRTLQLQVQILNREIGFLQDELQSLEGIQPVSRCCKELNEFVGAKPDPIIPVTKKRHGSCRMWRWFRSTVCCCVSWICCLEKKPNNCSCPKSSNCECCSCECTCDGCNCPNCPNCTCCNSCAGVNPCNSSSICCPSCSTFCNCKPNCSSCNCSSCCSCCSTNCCYSSCCKCSKPKCCTDCGSCSCGDPCCCRCTRCLCSMPNFCFSKGFSRCKLSCGKSICCCRSSACCAFRTPRCPECSCGCVWSCPSCSDVCRCIKRNNPCCISGCFC